MEYLGETYSIAVFLGFYPWACERLSEASTNSQLANYLQNPLKNQLCEDNFWLFLYLITKNMFILMASLN